MKPLTKQMKYPKVLVRSAVMSTWLITCDSKFSMPEYLVCSLELYLRTNIGIIKDLIHTD